VTIQSITRRKFIGGAIGLGLGGLLTACQVAAPTQTPPSPPLAPAAKPSAATGATAAGVAPTTAPAAAKPASQAPTGELRVAHSQKVVNLDPSASAERVTGFLASYMMDPLVEQDLSGQLVGRLATSWRAVEPTAWEFKLRSGINFHNGEPFNSSVVKFSLERFKDEKLKSSPLAPLWAPLDVVDTPDDTTAIIKTKTPVGPLLQNLTQVFMLPPQAASRDNFQEQPVGTGPFKFVSWTRGDRLMMEAIPAYWEPGSPRVQRVTWREVPEVSTRVSALERGELDLVVGIPPEEFPRLQGVQTLQVEAAAARRMRILWVNGGTGPTQDARVRQAINYAIDKSALIDDIMGSFAKPSLSYIEASVFGYSAQSPYNRDIGRAKQLLSEAGQSAGFDIEMKWSETEIKQKEIAEFLNAQLGEVGIRVKSVQQDRAVWLKDLLDLNWGLNLLATGTNTGDADFTLRRLYVSSANRTGYNNDQLDKLLNDASATTDQDKRKTLYVQAQDILWKEGPSVQLFEHVESYGWSKKLDGFVAPPDERPRLAAIGLKST